MNESSYIEERSKFWHIIDINDTPYTLKFNYSELSKCWWVCIGRSKASRVDDKRGFLEKIL